MGIVYLLVEREFIKTKEAIYKIGQSKHNNYDRLIKSYPKGSQALLIWSVKDCVYMEKIIIEEFKKTYRQRKDIGREYFEGNPIDMARRISTIIIRINDTMTVDDHLTMMFENYLEEIALNKSEQIVGVSEQIVGEINDYKVDNVGEKSFKFVDKIAEIPKTDNHHHEQEMNEKKIKLSTDVNNIKINLQKMKINLQKMKIAIESKNNGFDNDNPPQFDISHLSKLNNQDLVTKIKQFKKEDFEKYIRE